MLSTHLPSAHSLRPSRTKGLAWMLEGRSASASEPKGRPLTGISQAMQQSRKWKKNAANRFAGYAKVIKRTVAHRLREQDRSYNGQQFESLRRGEAQRGEGGRRNEEWERGEVEQRVFELRRRQVHWEKEAEKVGKLKEITLIFEQKKQFYDGCLEHYFSSSEGEIQKMIARLSRGAAAVSRSRPLLGPDFPTA
jgi:hypothetical protein